MLPTSFPNCAYLRRTWQDGRKRPREFEKKKEKPRKKKEKNLVKNSSRTLPRSCAYLRQTWQDGRKRPRDFKKKLVKSVTRKRSVFPPRDPGSGPEPGTFQFLGKTLKFATSRGTLGFSDKTGGLEPQYLLWLQQNKERRRNTETKKKKKRRRRKKKKATFCCKIQNSRLWRTPRGF